MVANTEDSLSNSPYVSEELAIIVPTKDRPNELDRFLQSIVSLDCKVGRIIIVASGQNIQDVVMKYNQLLPVEYYTSEPGQIGQRNQGISLLSESTRLVATMDDDTVFKKNSVTEIIKFWNNIEPETAGVGFNIVGHPPHRHTWIRGIFGASHPEPGRVLKSGINTSITNLNQNLRTEWLTGGATVWRQDILKRFEHREIRSKWCIGEDLIFSYPIGQKFPLYVCSSAKLELEELEIMNLTIKNHIFRGKAQYLWSLYFILSNENLSLFHFMVSKILESVVKVTKAIILLKYYKLYNLLGLYSGIITIIPLLIKNELSPENVKHLIEENG